MPELMEDKVPVMFIELSDMRDSGFIKDGTENTPHEEKLRSPLRRYIPNIGYRKGEKLVKDPKTGKEVLTKYNEQIRFIRNETEISVRVQKELGIEPAGKKEDRIVIERGYATVAREGSDIGLYDYLKDAFYNETNPDRSEKATALYRIVEKDKQAEFSNEGDFIVMDALAYIKTLRTVTGEKDGKKLYRYNEEKINGLCELLAIFAETNATKVQAIIFNARNQPEWFMSKVTKWEQTTETEVTHALKLNVIRFNKNVAEYVTKEKIIKLMGSENLKHDDKISRLSDWLRTSDGHEAYMELKAELEAAKEQSLKN